MGGRKVFLLLLQQDLVASDRDFINAMAADRKFMEATIEFCLRSGEQTRCNRLNSEHEIAEVAEINARVAGAMPRPGGSRAR